MYFLKIYYLFFLLILFSCGSGGPLTPLESFKVIKSAVEKNDSEMILSNLTKSSLNKINTLSSMIKEMRSDQISVLSEKYGYSPDKIKNLKNSDSIALYFFSDATNIKLGKYFQENIVSTSIHGGRARLKTESGIELDFIREGPYWKFDISDL
jgi:hypothetical protein